MNEIEVRGFIESKEKFEKLISAFQSKDYSFKKVRRLSIVSGDYKLRNLETRLRTTEGKITLAQKKGDVGAITREEIEFTLNIDSKDFYKMSRIIENLSKQTPDPYCVVIQHENYLFSKDDLEIKLFRQFGKGEFFGYEVEKANVEEEELKNFTESLGLTLNDTYDDDKTIRHRNSEINLPLGDLDENGLRDVIEDYF